MKDYIGFKTNHVDYPEIELPYSEETDYLYAYNKQYNITICVQKRQPNESNEDVINRINEEINHRCYIFEANVAEWNRFNYLSQKGKEKEALKDYSTWNKSFISKADKKIIIDRYIKYKSQLPTI